jgi:hypothetical protein
MEALRESQPAAGAEAELYKYKPPEASGAAPALAACSICGFPMEAEWRVCPNCVTKYETKCRTCGKALMPWWLICPWCETRRSLDHFGK